MRKKANFCIISNNPALCGIYEELVRHVDGTPLAVLTAVRDAVHLGARLISHPLAGSVKPNETPYRSVVLSMHRGAVDMASLQLIEDALATLKKLPEKKHILTAGMTSDYSVIDLDLVHSAMQALPAEYYGYAIENEEAHHVNGL